MGFKENLRKYREALGINAKDFASQIGVAYTTYANYENVGSEPKYATLIKIATALHVSIDELLGYKSDNIGRNMDLCKQIGLQVNANEEGVTIFHDKEQIGKLSPDMFNMLVSHALETSALSAGDYFKLEVMLYASKIQTVERVLKDKGIELSPDEMLALVITIPFDKYVSGFLLNHSKKDSEFAKYVQKAIDEEIEK